MEGIFPDFNLTCKETVFTIHYSLICLVRQKCGLKDNCFDKQVKTSKCRWHSHDAGELALLSLEHMKSYLQKKALRRYVSKYISQFPEIDKGKSKQWTCNKYMTSHFEACACSIQEQQIGPKDLISWRNKKIGVHTDNHSRLCKNQVEDMFHIMSSCSRMSSSYYLPLRHDAIAKYVYEQQRMKLVPGCKVEYPADIFIHSKGNIEYWWNLSIKNSYKNQK